jgi:MFS family permease
MNEREGSMEQAGDEHYSYRWVILGLLWTSYIVVFLLVLYLKEVMFMPVVTAGGILAVSEAAGAIGRPGTGFLSDRFFGGSRKNVFILMAVVAAVLCLVLALFGPSLSWLLYPVLFLLGFSAIAWGGLFLTLISEFGGHGGTGKAVGVGTTVALLGGVFGPPAFGHIVDVFDSYRLAWSSLALISAICVVLLFFVREERRKI